MFKKKTANLLRVIAATIEGTKDGKQKLKDKKSKGEEKEEAAIKHNGENYIKREGFFYNIGKDKKPQGYPCCSRCWDKDRELIRIIKCGPYDFNNICPACKTEFPDVKKI